MLKYIILFIVWFISVGMLLNSHGFLGVILFLLPIIYIIYRLASSIRNLINRFFINPKKKKELLKRLTNDCDNLNKLLINFHLTSCSKCSDSNHYLKKINNEGTSIQVKCETCGKISWIKPFTDNYDTYELTSAFHSYEHLKLYNEDYSFSFNYSELNTKKEKQSRHISQSVKDKVWNRDNGKCVECGSNENLKFDHIIPHSKGGANTYRNIQLLCEPCNRSKSAKIG